MPSSKGFVLLVVVIAVLSLGRGTDGASITVLQPVSGGSIERGRYFTIQWTTSDPALDASPFHGVELWLFKGDSSVALLTEFGDAPNSGTYRALMSPTMGVDSDYRVRARLMIGGDSLAEDFSDYFSVVLPREIAVSSPGSVVYTGQVYGVVWSTQGSVSSVDVSLRRRMYSTNDPVVAGFPNSGSINWNVPSEFLGEDYYIRVSDSSDLGVYGDSPTFEIHEALYIEFTFPEEGDVVVHGTLYPIVWTTYTGESEWISLLLYKGGEYHEYLQLERNDDGLAEWRVPVSLTPDNDYQLAFADHPLATFVSLGPSITISAPPPTILITNIDTSTVWWKGDIGRITWEVAGDVDAFDGLTIELLKGSSVVDSIASSIQHWQESMSYRVDSGLATGSDYRVRMSNNGATSVVTVSEYFSITPPPSPAITVTYPDSDTILVADAYTSIKWSWVGVIDEVDIELWKGSSLEYVIANDVLLVSSDSSPKSHAHPLSDTLAEGNDYRVRVVGGGVSDFSDYFRIQTEASIQVNFPGTGSILYTRNNYEAAWEKFGNTFLYYYMDHFRGSTAVYEGNTRLDGPTQTFSPQSHWFEEGQDEITDMRVRIRATIDENIFDFSDYYTMRKGQELRIDQPSWDAPDFPAGSPITFEWIVGGSVTRAKLELQRYNDDTFDYTTLSVVAPDIDATSLSYVWNVPETLAPGRYYVYMTSLTDPDEENGERRATSRSYGLDIIAAPPRIEIQSHTSAGQTHVKGDIISIEWFSVSVNPVSIILHRQSSGSAIGTIATNIPTTSFEFDWIIPSSLAFQPADDYYFIVSDSVSGASDTSAVFTIEEMATSVDSVLTPALDTVWTKGSGPYPVTWTFTGPVINVNIALLVVGSGARVSYTENVQNVGEFSFPLPEGASPAEGRYQIRVENVLDTNSEFATSAEFSIVDPVVGDDDDDIIGDDDDDIIGDDDDDDVIDIADISVDLALIDADNVGRFLYSSTYNMPFIVVDLTDVQLELESNDQAYPMAGFDDAAQSADAAGRFTYQLDFSALEPNRRYVMHASGTYASDSNQQFDDTIGQFEVLPDWIKLEISTSYRFSEYSTELLEEFTANLVEALELAGYDSPENHLKVTDVFVEGGDLVFEIHLFQLTVMTDPPSLVAMAADLEAMVEGSELPSVVGIESETVQQGNLQDPSMGDEFNRPEGDFAVQDDLNPSEEDDDDDDSGGDNLMLYAGIGAGALVAVAAAAVYIKKRRGGGGRNSHMELDEV